MLIVAAPIPAQGPASAGNPGVGPVRGSLVIIGGGLGDKEIVERIIALAGGRDAPAGGYPDSRGSASI